MSQPGRPAIAYAVATWFGAGRFPVGPGTAGSIAAMLLALAGWYGAGLPPWSFAAAGVLLCFPAAWAAREVEQVEARHDPSFVVVDEVAGQWITLIAVDPTQPWQWLAALVLFRIFDILKPPPLRRLERLPHGWGVVADDLAAGLYAIMMLAAARYWI